MKANQQTLKQIERALRQVITHYSPAQGPILTDIHLLARSDSGELCIYDDDDAEIVHCVIDGWVDNQSEDFYEYVSPVLRQCIHRLRPELQKISVMHPFSFLLVDEDKETIQDLALIDDEDTVTIDGELLKGLEEDLDNFFQRLFDDL